MSWRDLSCWREPSCELREHNSWNAAHWRQRGAGRGERVTPWAVTPRLPLGWHPAALPALPAPSLTLPRARFVPSCPPQRPPADRHSRGVRGLRLRVRRRPARPILRAAALLPRPPSPPAPPRPHSRARRRRERALLSRACHSRPSHCSLSPHTSPARAPSSGRLCRSSRGAAAAGAGDVGRTSVFA